MDPAQLVAPVFGVAAAAAITFYAVSFMQMSEKSFKSVTEKDFEKPQLRSTLSAKEKRKLRQARKEGSNSSSEE